MSFRHTLFYLTLTLNVFLQLGHFVVCSPGFLGNLSIAEQWGHFLYTWVDFSRRLRSLKAFEALILEIIFVSFRFS